MSVTEIKVEGFYSWSRFLRETDGKTQRIDGGNSYITIALQI